MCLALQSRTYPLQAKSFFFIFLWGEKDHILLFPKKFTRNKSATVSK